MRLLVPKSLVMDVLSKRLAHLDSERGKYETVVPGARTSTPVPMSEQTSAYKAKKTRACQHSMLARLRGVPSVCVSKNMSSVRLLRNIYFQVFLL